MVLYFYGFMVLFKLKFESQSIENQSTRQKKRSDTEG